MDNIKLLAETLLEVQQWGLKGVRQLVQMAQQYQSSNGFEVCVHLASFAPPIVRQLAWVV